jgi:hypothetical protein
MRGEIGKRKKRERERRGRRRRSRRRSRPVGHARDKAGEMNCVGADCGKRSCADVGLLGAVGQGSF